MASRRTTITLTTLALFCGVVSGLATRQQPSGSSSASPWAEWVEPDFPFFSSVLDAGRAGPEFPTHNLTPRGLILNLGRGLWVGFDTDLLRVAAMWQGTGVTPRALAPGSYHEPDRKTPGGQSPAPEPAGTVWVANGIYPGWQAGARPSFDDPREPAPTVDEVGRGPLPAERGRFKAIRLVGAGVVLEYIVRGANVREWISVTEGNGAPAIVRNFQVEPANDPLWLMLGTRARDGRMSLCPAGAAGVGLESLPIPSGADTRAPVWAVKIAPHQKPVQFCVAMSPNAAGVERTIPLQPMPTAAPARRWPQEVTTKATLSTATDAYVVDEFALPVENPWRRNVRPGDIQFLRDGTGVSVTLDGDVWMIRSLHDSSGPTSPVGFVEAGPTSPGGFVAPRRSLGEGGPVRWKRFASGLHEPLTLAIRDDHVYVFDRNGIWRLVDTNGDGEADVHELFANAFAQTADMREFPSTVRLAPDGEFVIAKGGQEATTIGKHNGSVLRISADGRTATVLGYGFRQPQVGVNVRTGLVTASDQQGHYIPSTPLHIVRDRQFYGFLSDKLPREVYPAPIAEPLTWIPHSVNASAMSQVWLFGARMGPLNDALVHIGFNQPELFRVMLNTRGAKPQAAVTSITRAFEFPPLNGSVNPLDGQLYLAGFQVLGWGTTATRLAGLGRVRYTGAETTLPREVVPMDKGVLLRFETPLDPKRALDPASYVVTTWHYKRTYQYGSPLLRADGTPGVDRLSPSSAYLSKDGRSVFIGLPGMTPVMQMHVGWTLATASGKTFQDSAAFTPYELSAFTPEMEGFESFTVDLTPKSDTAMAVAPVAGPPSAEEGRRIYERYGCMACHGRDDSTVSRLGPNFKGLYGSERTFLEGAVRVTATEAYLRESILEPAAKIVPGFNRIGMGMPSFAGVLTEPQIESVILYIKSLK